MDLRQVLGGIILCVSVSVADQSNSSCVTRRCLASWLIDKSLYSQPQSPSCDITVHILNLKYRTISVDTKQMHFSSQLSLIMKWTDPELSWNQTMYNVSLVVLPANKIWTPRLTVENAVSVRTKAVSNDVVVSSNGGVVYKVVMHTTVKCTINLFNYPFVYDFCPVALNGWTDKEGCGMHLRFHKLNWTDGGAGEWITKSVSLSGMKSQNYLNVQLTISTFNAVVSLIMPSVLIVLADLLSCMLPLRGGERNSFKVTLVLSFTMFLLQLTNLLPDTGSCSPLLRWHFLICYLLLVVSMLSSLVLTHMAGGCRFLFCLGKKVTEDQMDWLHTQQGNGTATDEVQDDTIDTKGDSIRKVVSFLKTKRQQEEKEEKAQAFAEKWDRVTFLVYFSLCVIYIICLSYITTMEFCSSDNLNFWVDE